MREQDGFFADEAAEAMNDEDERARRRIGEVVEEVRSMIDQPVGRYSRLLYDVGIVAVGEEAGVREFRWEECLRPRHRLPVGCPCALSVPSQTMHKANVDCGIGAIVPQFHPVRKG